VCVDLLLINGYTITKMGKSYGTNYSATQGRGFQAKKKNPITQTLKIAAPIVGNIAGGQLAGGRRGGRGGKGSKVKKGVKLGSDLDPEIAAARQEAKAKKHLNKAGKKISKAEKYKAQVAANNEKAEAAKRTLEKGKGPLNPPSVSSGMSSGNKKSELESVARPQSRNQGRPRSDSGFGSSSSSSGESVARPQSRRQGRPRSNSGFGSSSSSSGELKHAIPIPAKVNLIEDKFDVFGRRLETPGPSRVGEVVNRLGWRGYKENENTHLQMLRKRKKSKTSKLDAKQRAAIKLQDARVKYAQSLKQE